MTDITKLDFSRFHPMDHRPWQCWARNREEPIYGKTWTHLKYWWTWCRPGAWDDAESVNHPPISRPTENE